MEIKYKDFTIGYQKFIDFPNMENTGGKHICTLRLAQTPDGSSYVIVYTWVNHIIKMFDDRTEAFYIDGINEDNNKEAEKILLEVYKDLLSAYEKNPYNMFNMETYIENKFSSGPKSMQKIMK